MIIRNQKNNNIIFLKLIIQKGLESKIDAEIRNHVLKSKTKAIGLKSPRTMQSLVSDLDSPSALNGNTYEKFSYVSLQANSLHAPAMGGMSAALTGRSRGRRRRPR